MEQKLQLLKPRNFGENINDTLAFLKLNIKPFGQVLLFLILPVTIFGCYFLANFMSGYLTAVSGFAAGGGSDPSLITNAMLKSVGSILLGYLGIFLSGFLLSLTIIQLFLKYEQSPDGVVESSAIFDGLKSDFLRFFGFMFGFVILLVLGMFVIMFGAGLIIALASAIGGVYFAALVGIAVFVAITYPMVAISFAPYAYMRERAGFMSSFSRSMYLVKGRWWRTFGTLVIMSIIVYIACIIFAIPFYALFFVSTLHSIKSGGLPSFEFSIWSRISFIFMMCGVTVLSSIIYTSLVIQYYSMVEEKDGENVMQQIENIGDTENPGNLA